MAMHSRDRNDSDFGLSPSGKKCRLSEETGDPVIEIDHTSQDDHKKHREILRDCAFNDANTNIKFVVNDVEIAAHRQVIDILKNKRKLVQEAIEKDKKLAQKENAEEATVFQLSGTTPQAFSKLLEYIYTGRVECDLSTSIDLATTAHKLKFHPLVASLAQHLNFYRNQCLSLKTADDLYHIGKISDNIELRKSCAKFLDEKATELRTKYLSRDSQPNTDHSNVLVYAFDRSRYCNYIHFLLPETIEVCFNVSVSADRINWIVVLANDEIWSKFWNWVYFEERRVKYIKITFTDTPDGQTFDIHHLDDTKFLVKRANVKLEFDRNPESKCSYLVPHFDVSKFPLRDTKYYFNGDKYYTYCMSRSSVKDKQNNYYYHTIGDKNYLEFYLSQTCLVDSFRIRLWDLDAPPERMRTYDFTVEIKNEDDDDFMLVKDGPHREFRAKSSWQIIHLDQRRAVRWIRITGVKGPKHDKEFAIIDFECPAIG